MFAGARKGCTFDPLRPQNPQMSHADDPFAPKPDPEAEEQPAPQEAEASPESEPVEVEAEPVEPGVAAQVAKTIDVSEEPKEGKGDSTTWAVVAHLGPLVLLFMGISMPLVFLLPLVLLHTVAEGNSAIEHHAKEAMNFHLNVALISLVLTVTCILIPLLIPLWVGAMTFGVIATIKTANGELYRYPWIYRVVE